MNVKELMAELKSANVSWLENQYPAIPSERYSSKTYLNYQNLQDCFGEKAKNKIQNAVLDHPEVHVVVVAELYRSGKRKCPRVFIQNEADYYGQYELFACAALMEGFVEVFHNIKRVEV